MVAPAPPEDPFDHLQRERIGREMEARADFFADRAAVVGSGEEGGVDVATDRGGHPRIHKT